MGEEEGGGKRWKGAEQMPTGGAGVTEGRKLPACWVPNSRPLQEQYILLAIESSLAPRKDIL